MSELWGVKTLTLFRDCAPAHTDASERGPIHSIHSIRDGTRGTAFIVRTGNATVRDDGIDVFTVFGVVVVFANARRIVKWEEQQCRRGLWRVQHGAGDDSTRVREQETGEIQGVAREEIGERW